MTKRSLLATRLMIALAGSTVLYGGDSIGQAVAAQELQRIEITGSNIRRVQLETASPVQIVSRDDIEKSGKASVAEFLQTLALDNQGSVPTTFSAGFAAGASGISLRGLGAASTLVLVNGRRVAPYGLADDGQKLFTDLNMIPLDGVERVEILKDGASAIYGSDAIAGVVNVILRKDFKGTVARVNFGASRYGDGTEKRASITTGFGDIDKDRYNLLFNFEVARQGEIYNQDRGGRAQTGRSDLRDLGFDATTFTGGNQGLGGTGAIIFDRNAAGSSVNGNVRNPTTSKYYSRGDPAGGGFTRTFPRAACSNFTSHQQGDPNGGCLTDAAQQYGQIRPSQETVNFFGRGALQLTGDLQAYVEGNLYTNRSVSFSAPSVISTPVGSPVGPVNNLGVSLGAAHPDNPYSGTARLRYLAADVGPQVSTNQSTFTRFVAGIKGTVRDWDIDSALLFSQNKVTTVRTGSLQRDVAFALLDPSAVNVANATAGSAAYAALPVGTFWRIAENANLNSAAMYAALSPTISNSAVSQVMQVDFKASRELGSLPGGPMGIALGTEFRRESVKLVPIAGTERGNVIGLGYSAYDGQRNVSAAFVELLAPVIRTLEVSVAVRADHYSDFGTSVTPKLGAKWTPAREFALRGTYAEGFRAPGAAENDKGGVAAFLSGQDPIRCALGIPGACEIVPLAVITSPNPNLKPEKSKSYTLGLVWDPAPKTSIAVDFWQIVRRNEINHERTEDAIAAGHVVRDPSTGNGVAGDPGVIVAVLANYVNSAKTTVRGVDVDMRQGFDFGGGMGRLTLDAKWTHLFTWLREEKDGSKFSFAGTHGNCDISNCMGMPADRLNLVGSWDQGGMRVSTSINYRASLKNVRFEGDPLGCASLYANGSDAPSGCRIASFTTVDLNVRWKATDKLELFGGVQNLFDRIAPLDPLTYGATSYNPLDLSGAVGRYFNAGVKYKF